MDRETPPPKAPPSLWVRWLLAANCGVMAGGLAAVLAPDFTLKGFSLLLYANAERIYAFGPDAVAYIALVHAVLGGVMFGWGVALLKVIHGPFARGAIAGWRIVAVSVAAWFIPDTIFSLVSGFWQNALLNAAIAVTFALPLAATYRVFRKDFAEDGKGTYPTQ